MAKKAPKLETITVTHALTVRQPYAEMIRRGDKLEEYRSWPLPEKHRNEWTAIHAAAKPDDVEVENDDSGPDYPRTSELPRSVIVALVKFVDCVEIEDGYAWVIGELAVPEYGEKLKGGLGFWKLPEPLAIEYDPAEFENA